MPRDELGPGGRRLRLGDTDRAILSISIPALATAAIDPLLTLTDTAFVARLGTTQLAALGVNAAIVSFAFFAFNFLAFVTTPLVARSLGRGRPDEARHYVGTALMLAVAIGVVITVVLRVFADELVAVMGARGEVAVEAASYLRIRALAAVFVFLVIAGHGSFRGHKDTRTPLMVAVVVNVINLVLDPIFIFSAGWGLEGAAWATVVAQGVGAAMFLVLIARRDMARRPVDLKSTVPALMTLGRNGSLLIMRSVFLLATFAFAAATATRLGAEHIAAHQLVAQVFILGALIADSVEIAGQALVAESTGSGDSSKVRDLTKRLLAWGAGIGLALMVLLLLGRYALPLIASDEVVADLAVAAAGVAAVVLVVGAVVFVADGIFMGLLAPGAMAMSTAAGAMVAFALIQWTGLGRSLTGVWWAIGAFLLVRALILWWRYPGSLETAVRS
jgi:putative MATE family efflux protein